MWTSLITPEPFALSHTHRRSPVLIVNRANCCTWEILKNAELVNNQNHHDDDNRFHEYSALNTTISSVWNNKSHSLESSACTELFTNYKYEYFVIDYKYLKIVLVLEYN
jgi:hypothetical protein